jgi:transketolase C-terminal domain/subunit
MATTITPATLTISITEAITLGTDTRGSTHTQTIASVTEYTNRIINVGTAETDIVGFAAANGQGAYVRTDVAYMRFSNLDDTNYITFGISKTGADTVFFKLEAGQSLIVNNDDLEIDASGGASSAFVEADSISAKANGAAVDMEFSIALT